MVHSVVHGVLSSVTNKLNRFQHFLCRIGFILKLLKILCIRLLIQRRKQVIIVIFILFIISHIFYESCRTFIDEPVKTDVLLSISKCPACFGLSICEAVGKDFSVNCLTRALHTLPSTTGVLSDQDVVLERIGTTDALTAMERELCLLIGETSGTCNLTHVPNLALLDASLHKLFSYTIGRTPLMACPSMRLFSRIADRYIEKYDPVTLTPKEQVQLIATLLVNQEPIVFQTFSQYDLFPVKLYIGACGHYVLNQIEGDPLRSYYSSDWRTKARIAILLLETAVLFTENLSEFSLYWTDLSFDSFVYNWQKNRILVNDGRHIMVVDKLEIQENKPPQWDEPVYSEFDACDGDCSRSRPLTTPKRLCSALSADHNYYAICRNLLSSYACQPGGHRYSFLRDIPSDVDDFYGVRESLDECARPSEQGTREQLVHELINKLQMILEMYG